MNAIAFPPVASAPLADFQPAQAGADPVIILDRVSKAFRPRAKGTPVVALEDVSLSIRSGEIVGIIGRSGAGKSTLVRLINGLEKPTGGTVTVAGVRLAELSERQARQHRRRIGMVFQHFNLLSARTAAGNVALPLQIAGESKAKIKRRVDELLELVGLAKQRDRYPAELSGGQKQRVGIARALATAPKVLLCDEATSALDPETTEQILELLARIRRELGVTIVLITHEMGVVKAIADRVAVLESGRVVEEGPTFEVFSAPKHPTTRSFLQTLSSAKLPDHIRTALTGSAKGASQAVVRVQFTGPQAEQPVLSRLARMLAIDINILSGQVETVGGRGFGTLVIAVPSDSASVEAVTAALTRLELKAEVLGYVA
ncbi:MAG: methionine ABC transporter ATP-binding protein [Variibacter sp.]|nr:methionine ABC transporter ATP-binding protein [Variibacter sp.]